MPYRTKLHPRPSAGDKTAWNLLARPKSGKLTESQFRQLLQCSQEEIKLLAGEIQGWAEDKRRNGDHNFIHSYNHQGNTKEWDLVKEQLGAWLTCHATWGPTNRFGILTSPNISNTEREALRHAIRFIANLSLRSKALNKVTPAENISNSAIPNEGNGTEVQPGAEHTPENEPESRAEKLNCIRRRSVVLVHPAEQAPLYRFPFQTVAKEGTPANLAVKLRATDVSWENFVDVVRMALLRVYPSMISFTIGTGRHHGEIQDAESFAVVLDHYMHGRYRDKMGNLLLYPWGLNGPLK